MRSQKIKVEAKGRLAKLELQLTNVSYHAKWTIYNCGFMLSHLYVSNPNNQPELELKFWENQNKF